MIGANTNSFSRSLHRQVEREEIATLLHAGLGMEGKQQRSHHSNLVAARIGTIRHVICASPAYLKIHGTPRHPSDLIAHDCITRTTLAVPDAWPFRINNALKSFAVRRRLAVTTAEAAIEATLQGAGVARVLCYQVAQARRDGRLVTILQGFEPEPFPLSLVYAKSRLMPLKLRAFLDFAIPRLKKRLV